MTQKRKCVYHIIASIPRGGAETLILTICKNLKQYDPEIQFKIITLFETGELEREFVKEGIDVECLNFSKYNFFRRILALSKYLRSTRPEIIHTHLYHGNLYGQIAAFLSGIRIRIAAFHNAHNEFNIKQKIFLNIGLLCATKIIAISETVKRFWSNQLIGCNLKTVVIYNAPSFNVNDNWTQRSENIEKKEKVFLLCLGNIHPIKGQIYAIKAMSKMLKHSRRFVLNIYGKDRNDYMKVLKNEIQELKLDDNVFLLGPTNTAQEVLKKHDILLMPSISEGFGLVSVEAMSVGIPVIASNIPVHQEILGNGRYGLIVNTMNSDLFCEAILSITENHPKYLNYSRAGKLHSQNFTISKMINRYHLLYNSKL